MALSLLYVLLVCLSVGESADTIPAGFRKDFFYPYDWYREVNLPDPVHGGRFQLVGVSQAKGRASAYYLNGKQVSWSDDDWTVDWMHVYPPVLSQGEPMWVTFHSRDPKWDPAKSGTIKVVTDSGGVAMDGVFNVTTNWANITWVATDTNYSTLLVHIRNGYGSTFARRQGGAEWDTEPNKSLAKRTISKVLLNGTDVTGKVKNKASLTVPPGSQVLLEIPLSQPTHPGDLYTLVVQYSEEGVPPAVAAGRIAKTHLAIEAWETTSDCPFPTVNDSNYQWHRQHEIDTFFIKGDSLKACGSKVSVDTLVSQLSKKYRFYALLDQGVLSQVTNVSNVLAVFMGDEADDKIDSGVRKLMNTTAVTWEKSPTLLTYVGGSRNRRNGMFAGITDIQGMDMYVAACAPHIQEWLHYPPLRGSYDYVRLTRDNHLPNPAWLYSQGLSTVWDAKIGSKIISHRDPDPAEYRIQAMSVIAACGKGLMYFQSTVETKEYYGDTWKEMAGFNKDIQAVSRFIFEGDCTDMVTTSDGKDFDTNSIAQAIRSRDAILLVVIGLKNGGGYSDVRCEVGENVHWDIVEHGVKMIQVAFPNDWGPLVDVFEVQNGRIVAPPPYTPSPFVMTNVDVHPSLITRLFVLASNKAVRQEIENNLKGW